MVDLTLIITLELRLSRTTQADETTADGIAAGGTRARRTMPPRSAPSRAKFLEAISGAGAAVRTRAYYVHM